MSKHSVPTFNTDIVMSVLGIKVGYPARHTAHILTRLFKKKPEQHKAKMIVLRFSNAVSQIVQCKATTIRKKNSASFMFKRIGHVIQFSQGCQKGNIVFAL